MNAYCCLVDATWKVGITSWHQAKLRSCTDTEDLGPYGFKNKSSKDDVITLFWLAPKLIKFKSSLTQDGDVIPLE